MEDKNPAATYGTTPLDLAAQNGHLKVCELIVKNLGKEAPQLNNGSMTHLHNAAYQGSVEIYSLLSNHLTNKNPSNAYGGTPLHVAAIRGHLTMCKFIMDSVKNKNPGNNDNYTPLHNAAANGHRDVCVLILENVQNKIPETLDRITPAMLAIQNNHDELGQLLKKAGQAT